MTGPPDSIDRGSGRRLFGRDAEAYERARPAYPERVFEVLAERCGLGPGTKAIEIGAGTGLATMPLLAAGADVTAVEPDPELVARLRANAGRAGFALAVETAPFERLDPSAATYDLAVAATSFHWIEPTVGLAKARELLRPGGWWAMWWNVFFDDTRPDPFHAATTPILGPLRRSPSVGQGGRPFALDIERRRAELLAAGFVDTEVEVMRWTARLPAEHLRALYSTFGEIAALPDAEREAVLDTLAAIADDAFAGVVERPFQTVLYTSRRA